MAPTIAERNRSPLGPLAPLLFSLPLGIATLFVNGSTAAAKCLVHGKWVALSDVVVRPKGTKPFKVDIVDAESVVAKVPAQPGVPTELVIDGAISFKGTRRHMFYTVASPVTTADGMVRLLPGALIENARSVGEDVVGSPVLELGEDLDGTLYGKAAESVGPVRLPCSSLIVTSTATCACQPPAVQKRRTDVRPQISAVA